MAKCLKMCINFYFILCDTMTVLYNLDIILINILNIVLMF